MKQHYRKRPNPDKPRHKPRQNPSIKLLRYRFGQMQARQDFERSRLQYDEAVRNKDYQLAQLGISLSAIEDKLADIPIVRSPKDGYVRKIKPWVGKDGKYTTTITIVSASSSKNENK